jgi:hypothetical protein
MAQVNNVSGWLSGERERGTETASLLLFLILPYMGVLEALFCLLLRCFPFSSLTHRRAGLGVHDKGALVRFSAGDKQFSLLFSIYQLPLPES